MQLFSIRLSTARRIAAASLLFGIATHVGFVAAAGTARIEVHPIETLDLSTADILRGGDPAQAPQPRTVAGELRLPMTTAERVPAIVFLHGDAGAVANQPPWIDAFVAMGIAVFTVDSFTGRQIVSASPVIGSLDGALPSAATRLVDAYRALAILAAHPRIDPTRIALMGVSSGARTTILAAMKRFSTRFAPGDRRFAAFVALYPPCNVRLVDDERLEAAPLRIYIGASDNVTRADACERYVTRLRAAGADATVTAYAGAFHGFDNPPGTTPFKGPDVPMFSGCSFEEVAGALVNVDTGQPPAPTDRCMTKGFTAGRDAAADQAVRVDVGRFLESVLLRR